MHWVFMCFGMIVCRSWKIEAKERSLFDFVRVVRLFWQDRNLHLQVVVYSAWVNPPWNCPWLDRMKLPAAHQFLRLMWRWRCRLIRRSSTCRQIPNRHPVSPLRRRLQPATQPVANRPSKFASRRLSERFSLHRWWGNAKRPQLNTDDMMRTIPPARHVCAAPVTRGNLSAFSVFSR